MTDMMKTVQPKTDQQNFDDFIGGQTRTIKITKVSLLGEKDQPVAIGFEGDNGKPWKPCLSMRRVLVSCWGGDGDKYIGRSVTLYGDPTVRFGGANVGGIRISHLSHISEPITIALTASKAKRLPYVVRPLTVVQKSPVAIPSEPVTPENVESSPQPVELINADQQKEIGDLLQGRADILAELISTFGSIAKIPAKHYAKVKAKIETIKESEHYNIHAVDILPALKAEVFRANPINKHRKPVGQ